MEECPKALYPISWKITGTPSMGVTAISLGCRGSEMVIASAGVVAGKEEVKRSSGVCLQGFTKVRAIMVS